MQESNKVANANKFTPKPGDKIICNNGEEFICCTKEFLSEKGCSSKSYNNAIFAYRDCEENETTGVEWTYFKEDTGEGYHTIREVIPQNSEVTDDKKEEVKEEPLYTLQEIKEAWDASGWVSSTMPWNTFRKNLMKNDDDFQEYIRLKTIYE